MRPMYLLLCFILFPFSVFAQTRPAVTRATRPALNEPKSCPLIYLSINGGIENPNGIVGVSIDVAPIPNFSVGAGVGLSSWGIKYFAEVRGYMGECHREWAGGLGITHNTGLRNFETQQETVAGDMDVIMDLDPVTNVFFNFYRFWDLGKRMNRVYLSFGYSFRLDNDVYTVRSPYRLTQRSEDVMDIMAPGGLSIGLGFYFDVTGKRK